MDPPNDASKATSALVSTAAKLQEQAKASSARDLKAAALEADSAPAAAAMGLASALESVAPSAEETRAAMKESVAAVEKETPEILEAASRSVDAAVEAGAREVQELKAEGDHLDDAADNLVAAVQKKTPSRTEEEEEPVVPRRRGLRRRGSREKEWSDDDEENRRRRQKREEKKMLGIEHGDDVAVERAEELEVRLRPRVPSSVTEAILQAALRGDAAGVAAAARKRGFKEGLGLRAALVADKQGRTVMHLAALKGHANLIKDLSTAWRSAAHDDADDAVNALRDRLAALGAELAKVDHGDRTMRPKYLYEEEDNTSSTKKKCGKLTVALVGQEYDACARDADSEHRARELRIEAAWRTALSARDDMGRTPLHYALACATEKRLNVLKAMLHGGADLTGRSPSLLNDLPYPLASDTVDALLRDPASARLATSNLFKHQVLETTKKPQWRPPGTAKMTSTQETDVPAPLFPSHVHFDAANGALKAAGVSTTDHVDDALDPTKLSEEEIRTRWTSTKHGAALVKWLRRAMREGARRRLHRGDRYCEGVPKSKIEQLLRAFEEHDPDALGFVDLKGLHLTLEALNVHVAYDTLEEIGTRYRFHPRSSKKQLDRRLLIDYEKLCRDAATESDDDDDEGKHNDEGKLSEEEEDPWSRSENDDDAEGKHPEDSGWSSSDDEEMRAARRAVRNFEEYRKRSAAKYERYKRKLRRRERVKVQKKKQPETTAREAAAKAMEALGPLLAHTTGHTSGCGSMSAQLWLDRMNEIDLVKQRKKKPETVANWTRERTSYVVGLEEVLKARRAVMDAHDGAGYTAMHYAAYNGGTEVIGLLRGFGANRMLRADDGALPDDVASTYGTRQALRKNVLVEFDGEFVSGEDVARKKKEIALQGTGYSFDRMPGQFYNDGARTLGDQRYALKEEGRVSLNAITAAAVDACDGIMNRRAGNAGAPLIDEAPDTRWRRVPSMKENVGMDLKRRGLRFSTWFDKAAYPFDRKFGDGRLRTPLHLAAEAGMLDAVIGFLPEEEEDMLFDVNAADADGWTALHHASARGGAARRRIALKLMDAGALPKARNLRGRTPLHLAASSALETVEMTQFEDAEMVAVLCRYDDEHLDAVDDAGETPLMMAAARARLKSVAALLARGANPWHGASTALHLACSSRVPGAASAARLLSQWASGGDGPLEDYLTGARQQKSRAVGPRATVIPAHKLTRHETTRTPYSEILFTAAKPQNTQKLLATPLSRCRDAKNATPRDTARSKDQREALDHLWAASLEGSVVGITKALRDRESHRQSTADALFRRPWTPVGAHDKTPLTGRTALHLVALGRGPGDFGGCARVLLHDAKANVDAEDNDGRTPVHYAAALGSIPVLRELLTAGADVTVADDVGGFSALHLASAFARSDAIFELRHAGASSKALDRERRTPKEVAGLRLTRISSSS